MLAPLLALMITADAPKLVKPVSLHAVTHSSVVVDFELSTKSVADLWFFEDVKGVDVEQPTDDSPFAKTHFREIVVPHWAKPSAVGYHLKVDGTEYRGHFALAPAPGSLTPFTFAVVGDARDHAKWAELSRAIVEKHPRFVVDTGDNIEGGDSRERWRDFYVAGAELFANTPYFAVRGNHDQGALYAEYNPAPSTGIGPSTYAFQYGNAGFIAIDSNEPEEPQQLAFVRRALESMKGGPIFVFQHHPLYSCGGHGSSPRMQQAFQKLFEQAHVAYDFAGHDHDLIDWKPVNGVHYAVSGGGGTVTYPLRGCQDAAFSKQSFGFMLVSVHGARVDAVFYDDHGIELYRVPTITAPGASIPKVDLAKLARP